MLRLTFLERGCARYELFLRPGARCELAACKTLASNFFSKRWAPKGCRLEGMILDTKGTRSFRCNAARACDHFRELERACRGGGEC